MNSVAQSTGLLKRWNVIVPRIKFSYSLLSFVVIADQLLLPMFRIGPVPFKISYPIFVFWFVHWLSRSKKVKNGFEYIKKVWGVFAIVLACIFLGEVWLASSYNVSSYSDTIRNVLTFALSALAFGLGCSSVRFRMKWLLYIFFMAIALNFLFIIFRNNLPSWFIDIYYPARMFIDSKHFHSSEQILMFARPRGLFGNPNVSMLMVNVIVLFIHLSIKNNLLRIRSAITATLLITLPILLAAILSSRNQFLVALLLSFLNYRTLRNGYGQLFRIRVTALIVMFVVIGSILIIHFEDTRGSMKSSMNRIYSIVQVFDTSQPQNSTIERPLLTSRKFLARFYHSPLLGSGISSADHDTFSEGTQHFHNDVFYILTISGLVGFFAMLWLFLYFASHLGWVVLILFVLPGLTNTFVLCIPAFIGYFLMTGVLFAALRRQRLISHY